ncbi:multiple cyclophane-containing RiPP AmcA [Streptomyces luteireticuli]|uniref:multiple cyclophane-containing RiPP AmcA n=1 Tax=Streptomyces luteireticuli TaxID=173858 RepID=UPI0035561C26
MTLLEQLATTDAPVVRELVTALGRPQEEPIHAKFDNRPTWDNWSKEPPVTFDNRPTWDNWDKQNKKK